MLRFADLSVPPDERKTLLHSIEKVMEHGQIINGPELKDFEEKLAQMLGVKYAFGVSSGTSSLYLALKALGIKEGDRVIVPCLSWISTVHAIKALGAEPIFCDIAEDLNIDYRSVTKMLAYKPKAIVVVHFMGFPLDFSDYKDINIPVVEDCAQSFMSSREGKYTGNIFDIGCFSFNPMKQLGGLGEAGAIVTDRKDVAEFVKFARYCGMKTPENNIFDSLNHRMDTIQAAILSSRLEFISDSINQRQIWKDYYDGHLPYEVLINDNLDEFCRPHWYSYTIKVKNRIRFMRYMNENGVETKVQHAPLLCDHKIYSDCLRDELINGGELVDQIVCLPFHHKMQEEDFEKVALLVKEFYKKYER